jgi:predicted dinucleotide-binding enzyme
MRIAVLGTGVVGQTLAGKLAEVGHDVMIGTREPRAALARTESPNEWSPAFGAWHASHPTMGVGTFEEAAAHGETIINATSGIGSLDALRSAGADNLAGKVLIDVANPLDFSHGMPPVLSVANTDSLGEEIQRAFPDAKVVKTLNTVTASLMIDPQSLADGDHDLFVAGNDAEAKTRVRDWLEAWFGWKRFVDLGDITGARGAEMFLAMWLRIAASEGYMVNVKVVRPVALS